ncbi:polynucleotide phosphorylase [Clostridium oryzae]|uniref:Uncharacterized protein n=1 Tax=Clostridium oryzae TaxID=1450648 RepID=A0A1V4IWE4_9CLOT|nr:polynucleotide phosphorylase [Clostridium oryzae]OPJ64150.1 hypothetical protein CLORY_06980 [Clostridium oryzae]
MQEKYIEPLTKLEYAPLEKNQEEKLRDFERKFNEEFGTAFYFMVMRKED